MPGIVIAAIAVTVLAFVSAFVPIPLWLYRLRRPASSRLSTADRPALSPPVHFQDRAGIVREAWVVRSCASQALVRIQECIALWPVLRFFDRQSTAHQESWALDLLHSLDSQLQDVRLLVWQWVGAYDRSGERHQGELERAGLDLLAARRILTDGNTSPDAADTQTALVPVRQRGRRELRMVRDQLIALVQAIDAFEDALRRASVSPYR